MYQSSFFTFFYTSLPYFHKSFMGPKRNSDYIYHRWPIHERGLKFQAADGDFDEVICQLVKYQGWHTFVQSPRDFYYDCVLEFYSNLERGKIFPWWEEWGLTVLLKRLIVFFILIMLMIKWIIISQKILLGRYWKRYQYISFWCHSWWLWRKAKLVGAKCWICGQCYSCFSKY